MQSNQLAIYDSIEGIRQDGQDGQDGQDAGWTGLMG